MTLPNFIVLGAAKAGTTALYFYLMQHPQVHVTPLKETNFFALEGQPLNFGGPGDDEYVNTRSLTRLDDYVEQYRYATGKIARGEASPLYLYSTRAVERIRHYAPDAKLVAFLRNPVDRAFSSFLHLVRDGREEFTDFRRGLEAEDRRVADHWEHLWHYKRMGLYHEQLRRYYDAFPVGQIKVFLYKDLRTEPERVMRDLFAFLGVDPTFVPDMSQRHNVTTDLPPDRRPVLRPEVRAELREYFRDDAAQLQALIGRDLSHWFRDSASEQEAEPPASPAVNQHTMRGK